MMGSQQMMLTAPELINIHEAAHVAMAVSHNILIERVEFGCTHVAAGFRSASPGYLATLVAGGMGESLALGTVYTLIAEGSLDDVWTMNQLVPRHFGKTMCPIVDHTRSWLKQPKVWRVVHALSTALDVLNGHLTGPEIMRICRELQLPTCRTCSAPSERLAPRKLSGVNPSTGETASELMDEAYQRQRRAALVAPQVVNVPLGPLRWWA